MNLKSLVLPVLGAIVISALVRYYWPRIETKTVTQTKVVETTRTITKIVKHKDGTEETLIDSTTNSVATKDRTATKAAVVSNWHTSLSAAKKFDDFEATRAQISIERRILGPIWAGALLSTNHEVGLIIGLEF